MELLIALLVVVLGWRWLTTSSQGGTVGQTAAPGPSSGDAIGPITQAIAQMEGWFKPGSLAQRTNNPGNIGTFGGKVASYPDAGTGFESLQTWVQTHAAQHPEWDFYDMFHYYLTGDTLSNGGPNQHPDAYAEYVANSIGVDPTTPVSSVLG